MKKLLKCIGFFALCLGISCFLNTGFASARNGPFIEQGKQEFKIPVLLDMRNRSGTPVTYASSSIISKHCIIDPTTYYGNTALSQRHNPAVTESIEFHSTSDPPGAIAVNTIIDFKNILQKYHASG